MADFSDDCSLLDEMDVDSANTSIDDSVNLDLALDPEDDSANDNELSVSGPSPQSLASDRSVSPNTTAVGYARVSSFTPVSPEYEDLILDESEMESEPLSPFEALPTELVQSIATQTSSDQDLGRLALTSPTFAVKLNSDNADIWRKRFLARYDHPILESVHDFAIAYKVRRFILRKLDGRAFALDRSDRAEHQLQVVKDMVLETYNKHRPYLPPPPSSKNLAAMSSPTTSPWILKFMGCALYENEKTKFGRPHALFDTLQVTLSHLVLSQRSAVLLCLSSSRENYDLARVYNYNKPLTTLLERVPDEPEETFKSKKFPNLKSPTLHPVKPQYKLDMHTLLHVRNFWQRHFADDVQGIGENTFASMVRSLTTLGKTPQKWDRPLQERLPVNTKWYGHYSCLHPWPKSRQDLEERQSCAEDWKHIDPMILDFETSTINKDRSFWPPAFSTIPAFAEALPNDRYHKEYNVTYLRGIAPFLELKHHDRYKAAENDVQADDTKLPKWHPFLASRIHGYLHDIPDAAILGRKPKQERFSDPDAEVEEKAIPGWKHIVMILYKATSRQLLSVLEHAMEEYGGVSGTEMNFNTAGIWSNGDGETNSGTPAQTQQDQNQSATAVDASNIAGGAAQDPHPNSNDADPNEEQIEARLRLQITRRIKAYSEIYAKLAERINNYGPPVDSPYRFQQNSKHEPKALPPLFSAEHIRKLEEAHSSASYMTWDDGSIEYTYAYEGVIIPGGKIMLGRWWRIQGIEGMGPGKEVGPDAVGVEVRPVAQPDPSEDASYEDEMKEGKRKAKRQGTRTGRRKSARKKRRRNVHTSDSGGDDDEDHDEEEQVKPEKETEYEFVTMLNGEESRAVNACKGLERGPFVFWA